MERKLALELLYDHTKTDSLRKHALGVEAAMRFYAKKFDKDENKWSIVGLLHDFDYEKYPSPDQHPEVGSRILRERGYPDDVIYAILSHAEYLGLVRESLMDKALFAVDELVGFITAVTLVRPNKNIAEVKVSSVNKKLKDKRFASSVDREHIWMGAQELGVDLDEHIAFIIEAMKSVSDLLGLDGL